jgi:hypothetical protein
MTPEKSIDRRLVRLTIDTNAINARGRLEAMNTLERWRDEGWVQLDATTRLLDETSEDEARAAKAATLNNISEPWILGVGRLGSMYLAGPGPGFREIASILFPRVRRLTANQQNDVMHMLSHAHGGGDYFITNDKKDFIKSGRREELRSEFGIEVLTPDEAVEVLHRLHGWAKQGQG